MAKPRTLYDKIRDDHVIETSGRQEPHLYRPPSRPRGHQPAGVRGPAHGRPQGAGAGKDARRRRPQHADHRPQRRHRRPESRLQVEKLARKRERIRHRVLRRDDTRQGIVHIIGPEQGFTLPGTTIVCGDSHTSTHGAFGALAHGIGTSEVEHVLATQTLIQAKAKNMRVVVDGALRDGVTAKDIILAIIGQIGTAGGTGYVIEYAGAAIEALSMEGRMTVCNMTIEGGARAGMVAPDETTFAYLKDRPKSPKGELWDRARAYWDTLRTDEGAQFDEIVRLDAGALPPIVSWGTSPQDVVADHRLRARVEDGATEAEARLDQARARLYGAARRRADHRSSRSTACSSAPAPTAGSRICAPRRKLVEGRKVAERVSAMVVPGSGLVKAQAEAEGLDAIFKAAGFEWREPGCSMCLAMNPDKLAPGERCASTSNRNFEGRQGCKGRTHLVSPAMAAAAAVAGRFVDVREWR